MNAVQRFFRRYILSTVGIVLLFFAVNIALLFVIIIAGGMSGACRMGNGSQMILPFPCCKNNLPGQCS